MQVTNDIASIAAGTGAAVVGLRGGARGGSGVVIARDRVLTLAHRLRADEVDVALRDGSTVRGTLLATDEDADAAVLSVATGDTTPLEWADEEPVIGAVVFALGDPAGAGLRVTAGTVSAEPLTLRGRRGRPLHGVIEHTAPLPRGSGGGPLVDRDGRLLGLNAVRQGGGLILALGARELRPRVDALLAGRTPRPRRLGVAVLSPRAGRRMRDAVGLPARDGLLVRTVDADGPAGRAGVRAGDLLVALGGRSLTGVEDLHAALDGDDRTLELELLRGADERTLTVELEAA